MATEVQEPVSLAQNGNVNGDSELAGAAILVVVGEPFSNEHKDQILDRIIKGFKSWDVAASGCDINAQLQAFATAAPAGEEGANGERIVSQQSETLDSDVLLNPQVKTLREKIKALLLSSRKYKHIVYSGHAFQGSGEWILQDDRFSYTAFANIVKDPDVENALKHHSGSSLGISTFGVGDWNSNKIAKESYSKLLDVHLNGDEKLSEASGELAGVIQFTAYLSSLIKVRTPKDLLRSSDVVGSIRFSKPTMYIFPGCEGDSALFGISGFHLLVNAGYNRKACFWDFTRHLDRIDAFLLTHLGADNILSVSTMMERKAAEYVHPEIGVVFFNGNEKVKHSPDGDGSPEDGGSRKPASLLVNLVDEGTRLMENMKQINTVSQPCYSLVQGNQIQPINLYHKVGHGTLDLYILNPQQDGKELKDFLSQWNKRVDNFSNAKSVLKASGRDMPVPLPDMLSICALLVWRPESHTENITRILFPGNCPQHKVFEGLDKLKNLDIFQHAGCSIQELKAGNKKPAGKAPPKSAARSSPANTARKPPAAPAADRSSKTEKATKEIKNKRAVDVSADKKKSLNKKSPSSASSSTKTTPSPEETATPIESPPSITPSITPSVTPSDTPADMQSPEPSQPPAPAAPQSEQPPEEPLVDLSLIKTAAEDIQPESQQQVEDKPEPLVDNFLTEASQHEQEAEPVKMESTEMPEADQGFVSQPPEPEAAVEQSQAAPELDSPEPLPDPTQFDPSSFVPSAEPEVQEKNLFSAPEPAVADQKPEFISDNNAPLVDFGSQNGALDEPVVTHDEPVVANDEPFVAHDEPVFAESLEPEKASVEEVQPECVNAAPAVEAEALHDRAEIKTEVEEPQAAFEEQQIGTTEAQVDSAPEAQVVDNAGIVEKKQFEDLGIYDDSDKDVDTAEAEFSQQQQQSLSQQMLEEMGIYDREEPESQQPIGQDHLSLDNLKDQGVCFGEEDSDEIVKMDAPEADIHTPSSQDEGVCAGESETDSQELATASVDTQDDVAVVAPAEQVVPDVDQHVEEQDVGGEPEVDQASYHSEVPQGLPSPQEPVLHESATPSDLPEDTYMDQVKAEEHPTQDSEDMIVPESEVMDRSTPPDPMSSLYSKEIPGVELIPETEPDREDSYEREYNPDFVAPTSPSAGQELVEEDPISQQLEEKQDPCLIEVPEPTHAVCETSDDGPPATQTTGFQDESELPHERQTDVTHTETPAAVSEPDSLIDVQDEPAVMEALTSDRVQDTQSLNPFDIMDAPQGFTHLQNDLVPSTNPFLGVSADAELPISEHVQPPAADPFNEPQLSSNPFDSHAASAEDTSVLNDSLERDSLEKERAASPNQQQQQQQQQAFDPLSSWGEPMGLPAPPPPVNGTATKKPAAKPAATRNGPTKSTPKKADPKKTLSPKKKKVPTATLR